MAVTTYLLTITLNANGLYAPIKRHTVAEWVTKQEQHMPSTRESLQIERPKLQRGRKNYFLKIETNKKNRVAVFIPD